VFSCKPYDNAEVVRTVEEFFAPSGVRVNYLTRDAN